MPVITLSLVVPCFNEEAVLPETARRLRAIVQELIDASQIAPKSRIFFVDDGSSDNTWNVIESLSKSSPLYSGIKLSRNCGHQNALLAGLLTVPGDVVITIDADLQDDPSAVKEMVSAHLGGAEIVYGVRDDRGTDGFLKRFTAEAYYQLLARFGVDIVFNHADYRLMSRRAITVLSQFKEVNVFLRGIVPLIGLKTRKVFYHRQPRLAGAPKYTLRKMLGLAGEGLISFSAAPLHMIFLLGLFIALCSFVLGCYVLALKIFAPNDTVHGWASTVLPMYFLGGVQILCVGIIGEYLGKLYMEVKARPRYFIESLTDDDSAHSDETAPRH